MQQQEQQPKNSFLFLILSVLLFLTWLYLGQFLWPKKPTPPPSEIPPVTERAKPDESRVLAATARLMADAVAGDVAGLVTDSAVASHTEDWQRLARKARPETPVVAQPEPPAGPPITLGDDTTFFLKAKIDPRGAAVRSLTLREFEAADHEGRPALDPETGKPRRMELIPGDRNLEEGSNVLFDCNPDDADARPYARLGKKVWKQLEPEKNKDGTVVKVAFQTEVENVLVTKTFSLQPGDYHLGLQVKIERNPRIPEDRPVAFRYHLTSGHGLPIEGEWYTNTLRNGVVVRVDDQNRASRSLQDLRRIALKAGGDDVLRQNQSIQAGGITVQYFSSLVVVDDEHPMQDRILLRARPVIVTNVLRGTVFGVAKDQKSFTLKTKDGTNFTIRAPEDAHGNLQDLNIPEPVRDAEGNVQGVSVAAVCRTDEHDRLVAAVDVEDRPRIYLGEDSNRLLNDDITMHLVSDRIELKAGAEPVVHNYLLYNGPVKVRLLGFLPLGQRPSQELVNRYENQLHLGTVTDYPSQWWGSDFFSAIGWSWLLIWCTNRMHSVLWLLHTYIMPWSFGLDIILLTLGVRAMMFPLSRRQAMTNLKMQALAPEIKKLQEKYKDDRQALGMAQMELYRKHGVNPVGSCWTILLQMPIFLGLYYALQESIQFRLSHFLWIQNLAAPDMLFRWGDWIPWISRPQDYGSFLYLGPYFNLLPVIVAGFMFVQQKMMTPPPADEQQEMQQRMMKFMTIFFALMFYKVAAGLCLYFIVSSLWGFTERQLLPKKKVGAAPPPLPPENPNTLTARAYRLLENLTRSRTEGVQFADSAAAVGQSVTLPAQQPERENRPNSGSGKRNKRNKRNKRRKEGSNSSGTSAASSGSSPQTSGDGTRLEKMRSWWTGNVRKAREMWADLLRKAEKR